MRAAFLFLQYWWRHADGCYNHGEVEVDVDDYLDADLADEKSVAKLKNWCDEASQHNWQIE